MQLNSSSSSRGNANALEQNGLNEYPDGLVFALIKFKIAIYLEQVARGVWHCLFDSVWIESMNDYSVIGNGKAK